MKETERKQLERLDKKYVWHPFTQMQDWLHEDIVIVEKADGIYLIDTKGNRYIDGVSSLWTNVHGHHKAAIDSAIQDQLGLVAHSTFLGLSNVPAIQLAEKLVACTPDGLEKVFYADSGSEAMEIALKVAYQYWCQKKDPEPERTRFVHLSNSYHGDTLGSVSVGGIDLFHKIYRPFIFETLSAPAPYCYRCPMKKEPADCSMECANKLEQIVERYQSHIAAIVLEPLMQGAAGMIQQPKGYLRRVADIARAYGVLLVCDEVATGFGRTGELFACNHEQVCPDIMALGKGITGGYLPLSATLFTEEIFNAFLGAYDELKSFFHGHTYTGNQLAARAAIANLDIFKNEQVLAHVQLISAQLEKQLKRFAALDLVGNIRHIGCMVGIELVKDKATKEAFEIHVNVGHRVVLRAREKGVIIRPLGNVIVLMPPLAIKKEELDLLLDVVYASIKETTEELRS